MQSLSIAKAVARQTGPYEIDDKQELFAVGACNVIVALLRGYPVTGSFSRTAVMASSGARSPIASFLAGLFVIPVLLAAAPVLSNLPKFATAAIVVVYIGRLVQPGEALRLWRQDLLDFMTFAATFCIVVFVDITPAFLVGIAVQWFVGYVRSVPRRSIVRLLAWAPTPQHPLQGDAAARGRDSEILPPDLRFAALLPDLYTGIAAALSDGLALQDVRSASAAGHRTSAPPTEAQSVAPQTHASEPLQRQRIVVALTFEPDLLFHSAARLVSHVDEALACYASRGRSCGTNPDDSPLAAFVLDFTRISTIDVSGASVVFSIAATIAAAHKGATVAISCADEGVKAALVRTAVVHRVSPSRGVMGLPPQAVLVPSPPLSSVDSGDEAVGFDDAREEGVVAAAAVDQSAQPIATMPVGHGDDEDGADGVRVAVTVDEAPPAAAADHAQAAAAAAPAGMTAAPEHASCSCEGVLCAAAAGGSRRAETHPLGCMLPSSARAAGAGAGSPYQRIARNANAGLPYIPCQELHAGLLLFDSLHEAVAWAADAAAIAAVASRGEGFAADNSNNGSGFVSSTASSGSSGPDSQVRLQSVPPSLLSQRQQAQRRALEPLMPRYASEGAAPQSSPSTMPAAALRKEPLLAVVRQSLAAVKAAWAHLGEERPMLRMPHAA